MISEIQLDIITLDDHLVDINQPEKIPPQVLDTFWELKKNIGSLALGIAFYSENGWYIVDSMGQVYFHSK